MKLVLAMAVACLLAALAYALSPADRVPAPQPLPVAAVEPPASGEEESFTPRPVEPVEARGEPPFEELLEDVRADVVITGRVTPSSGSQPDVHLMLQEQCPAWCDARLIEVDADPQTGEFSAVVPPSTWRIVARATGFLPAVEEGLALVAGEALGDIVMTLERGERITGSVTLDGEPVADLRVIALGEGYTRGGFTDAWGNFEIPGLPRGTFQVRAYSQGEGGDEKTATTGSTVHLSLGHHEKIRGRVVDTRGFPVEGAAVYSDYTPVLVEEHDLYPGPLTIELSGLGTHGCGPSPSCYQRAVTDAAGRFELDAAPGEALAVGARLGDRHALQANLDPGAEIELVLEAGVRVQLVDPHGQPLRGWSVPAEAPFFTEPLRSDDDGWLQLRSTHRQLELPPGIRVAGELRP